MHKQNRISPGFTIVELLIVIVVIAILAAISAIAYTGLQQRARTSTHRHAASQAEREIMTHALQANGESISLSNTLIGYKEGAGDVHLLTPLSGTPDITMYGVYEVIDASSAFAPFVYLTPNNWSNSGFMIMSGSGGSMAYRIDTSTQTNQTGLASSGLYVPGNKLVCWLQVTSSATVRAFGCNQVAPNSTATLTPHSGWNFTEMRSQNASDKVHAGLLFNAAHDQSTRAQVISWLAQKYGVSL